MSALPVGLSAPSYCSACGYQLTASTATSMPASQQACTIISCCLWLQQRCVPGLYGATDAGMMVSVSNRSTYMLAQLGNGSCVSSYSVTIGATALLTTVDYSTPVKVNCSYDVLSQAS